MIFLKHSSTYNFTFFLKFNHITPKSPKVIAYKKEISGVTLHSHDFQFVAAASLKGYCVF